MGSCTGIRGKLSMASFEKCCSRFNFLMFFLLWILSVQQKILVHVLMDLQLKIKTNGNIKEKML